MRSFLLLLSLLTTTLVFSQTPFEGEIDYRYSLLKKGPNFTVDSGSCMQTTTRVYFKDGSFAQFPNSCEMEYNYYDRPLNQYFSRLKGRNFIGMENYSQRSSDQDSVLSYQIRVHSDTVLGKVCNRITLVTASMRLIFIYSPTIALKPEWYAHTEGGYYNYIYGLTKAYWLKFIIETPEYTSQAVATRIRPGKISLNNFPDIFAYQQIPLDQ